MESQKKFSALFDANPEAAVFYDANFRVIEANHRFSKLFGYPLDEIIGKDIIELIVPDGAQEETKTIRERIKSGLVEIVTTRKRKDGVEIPLLLTGSQVSLGDEVIGSMFVFKDIGEIITAQEELSQALSKAQLLNEKLHVVGSLTRHDVRNKLSIITNYSYILKKKYADRPDIVDSLGKIETSVKDSVKIFDFAKVYEQLGVENLVNVDVEKTVNDAVEMFSGLPFKVVNECHGLNVRADSLLRQLIYNFIDNTRKYGQKTTTVRVSYQKAAQSGLQLIYEDDGVGIPLEHKQQIFKQGFSTGGSTGFGLFLSKKMLEVYGWTITEEGKPGEGARFVISIPSPQ
jgi:PAS domain S-box-containing protein